MCDEQGWHESVIWNSKQEVYYLQITLFMDVSISLHMWHPSHYHSGLE